MISYGRYGYVTDDKLCCVRDVMTATEYNYFPLPDIILQCISNNMNVNQFKCYKQQHLNVNL